MKAYSPVGKIVSIYLINNQEKIKIDFGYVETMTAHVICLRDTIENDLRWICWGPGMVMEEK